LIQRLKRVLHGIAYGVFCLVVRGWGKKFVLGFVVDGSKALLDSFMLLGVGFLLFIWGLGVVGIG
jgi:hypothetical protein